MQQLSFECHWRCNDEEEKELMEYTIRLLQIKKKTTTHILSVLQGGYIFKIVLQYFYFILSCSFFFNKRRHLKVKTNKIKSHKNITLRLLNIQYNALVFFL